MPTSYFVNTLDHNPKRKKKKNLFAIKMWAARILVILSLNFE